jgi:microcystin-dependent protein
MSNPFLAEIRIFPFNFAPKGWAFCDGQLLPISQSTALFSLLGTTYGGDGKSNFALPNFQGCAPTQAGQGPGLSLRDLGETAGQQDVTLLQTEMPVHSHQAQALASASGTTASPQNATWAEARTGRVAIPHYAAKNPNAATQMSPFSLSITGGNLPHNNMPPFLTLNFCIALQGVFPARS